MDEDKENIIFDKHQDLTSYSDLELQQLLQLNYQTSKHYSSQMESKDVPENLKSLYNMSKEFVDSDIKDIIEEIQARSKTKNDTTISLVSSCTNNG